MTQEQEGSHAAAAVRPATCRLHRGTPHPPLGRRPPRVSKLAAARPHHHAELGRRPGRPDRRPARLPSTDVYRWLHRFNAHGIDGLEDLPRSGRPRRLSELERGQIIALARSDPPGRLRRQPDGSLGLDHLAAEAEAAEAVAHWTLDALADAAQAQGIMVGRSQVRRILQAEGVRWRTVRSWSTSGDPEFAPKGPGSSRSTPRRHRRRS